jgi:hypothetical protein
LCKSNFKFETCCERKEKIGIFLYTLTISLYIFPFFPGIIGQKLELSRETMTFWQSEKGIEQEKK